MNKRIIYCCLLLSVVMINLKAQSLEFKIRKDVKKVRLNKYETDYRFNDGLLAVKNLENNKWGFIDEQGNLVIDYLWYFISEYDEGLSRRLLQPKFSSGKAWVYTQNGELCILDKNGSSILKKGIVKASDFCGEYATVLKKNRENPFSGGSSYKYLYVDKTGKEVFPALSQTVYFPICPEPRPFKDGNAVYYDIDKNKCGFVDDHGKIVVPAIFLAAQDFSEGLAAVLVAPTSSSDSKWGFIDTSGKFVIPAKFTRQPTQFYNGTSSVIKGDGAVVQINKFGVAVNSESNDTLDIDRLSRTSFSLGRGSLRAWEYILSSIPNNLNGYTIDDLYVCDYFRNKKFQISEPSELRSKFDETENKSIAYYSVGYSIDFVNEKIMHCKTFIDDGWSESKIINDGFVDYEGNYVFIFSPEEF